MSTRQLLEFVSAILFSLIAVPAITLAAPNPVQNNAGRSPTSTSEAGQYPVQNQSSMSERLAKAEARIEAQSDMTEWFGILIAIVGVGFGGLVTGIVVFFALRTEKSAIAAAKEELASSRQLIDEHVADARAAAALAQNSIQEIEQHRKVAAETSHEIRADADELRVIVEKASASSDPKRPPTELTEEEQQTLNAAALSIAEKPLHLLTPGEFDVLITEAEQKQDWYRARDLSRSMKMFHGGGYDVSKALTLEASALYRLGDADTILLLLNEIIDRFDESSDPVIRDRVIQATYNKAIIMEANPEEAEKLYSSVIRRFRSNASIDVRAITASALGNRAIINTEKGDIQKALADYTKAIKMAEGEKDETFLEPFVKAAMGKARLLADRGRKSDALRALSLATSRRKKIKDKNLLEFMDGAESTIRKACT